MNKPLRAIITGIKGQDAFYLSEQLSQKGYELIGTSHSELKSAGSLDNPYVKNIVFLDLTDSVAITRLVKETQANAIYNLAARSSSAQLFDDPLATAQINGLSILHFLEAIRQHSPHTHFCHISSSEVFAGTMQSPQNEWTALQPVNAYGSAKAYGMHLVSSYRKQFGLKAFSAVMFNHESPRRPQHYVTRKITHGAASVFLGLQTKLELGSLDGQRDWMHARDAMNGVYKMMQLPSGDDFIFGSGQLHRVRDICELAFSRLGLDYQKYVFSNHDTNRRSETVTLQADPSKARTMLGWNPQISFQDMIHEMVDSDLAQLRLPHQIN